MPAWTRSPKERISSSCAAPGCEPPSRQSRSRGPGARARVLDGGVQAWRRARLPLREGRKRLPVDRQVQLIAGVMVLTGVGLGLAVSPWFLALAAFFGAGLTFAGATGTCGLALLLMKLPWNATRVLPGDTGGAVCAAGGGAAPTCAAPTPPQV